MQIICRVRRPLSTREGAAVQKVTGEGARGGVQMPLLHLQFLLRIDKRSWTDDERMRWCCNCLVGLQTVHQDLIKLDG